jgi:hypothetical protein
MPLPLKTEPTTPEQHISQISADVITDLTHKYRKGQIEHGGKLHRKPVWEFAWEEVLDLPVYLHVLRHQRAIMIGIAETALQGKGDAATGLQEIHNILTIGNREGIPEAGD